MLCRPIAGDAYPTGFVGWLVAGQRLRADEPQALRDIKRQQQGWEDEVLTRRGFVQPSHSFVGAAIDHYGLAGDGSSALG